MISALVRVNLGMPCGHLTSDLCSLPLVFPTEPQDTLRKELRTPLSGSHSFLLCWKYQISSSKTQRVLPGPSLAPFD